MLHCGMIWHLVAFFDRFQEFAHTGGEGNNYAGSDIEDDQGLLTHEVFPPLNLHDNPIAHRSHQELKKLDVFVGKGW